MADQKARANAEDAPTPAQATREAAAEAKDPEDPTFPRERLINEAYQFIGEEPHVVAGAISAIHKQNLTVAEVKAAVKAFLATEVK